MTPAHVVLVVIGGLPGSGKTTVAAAHVRASGAAEDAGAALVDVEVVCSDPAEHRRRVESRTADVPGLVLPTWPQVTGREYEPWDRDRLVVDTALVEPDEATCRISEAVRRAR